MTNLYFSIPLPRLHRSHLIPLFFLLLTAAWGFAKSDMPKAKNSPCGLTETDAAVLNEDAGVSVHAVPDYSNAIHRLLQAEKLEQLDCLAESARSHRERFPGGMWKIHAIYSGLAKPPLHPTQEDWTTHLELLQRWASARPESITARVALAKSYVNYGEDARGSGFADTVSESGWKLLAERTTKAKLILDDASKLSAKDPEWYVAMQELVLHQDWETPARRALLEQAVKFEPEYYYYYRLFANSIQPKWGGEEGEVETFLQESSDRIGGDAGDILYFRVAGTLVCGCQSDQQLKFSWPRIQKGFAAVEKQNGPAPENWNLLAHMAVSFNDALVADRMFTKIGDQWSEDTWRALSYFESSKEWARQVAPSFAKRHDAEEAAEANMHSAEGQNYSAAFVGQIQMMLQPCIEEASGTSLQSFNLLMKVGKDGNIQEMTGGGNMSSLTQCLGKKLMELRVSKLAAFPAPPQPDYWVRFDFNPEHPAAAALK